MTYINIHPNFTPTYLYVKRHIITGLCYFGKTIQKDPIKYKGSGVYWLNHIKKHGYNHIETIWYRLFENREELIQYALDFSIRNNIVESDEWANLTFENGLDGGQIGCIIKEETRQKLSEAGKGRIHSEESKNKLSKSRMGMKFSQEHREKLADAKRGSTLSEDHKMKISESMKGRPHQTKKTTCPHCGLVGGATNMTRYHFDNCKLKELPTMEII